MTDFASLAAAPGFNESLQAFVEETTGPITTVGQSYLPVMHLCSSPRRQCNVNEIQL